MTSSTDDPLVSTDWLAAHIDDPKVRIIDATFKLPGVLPLPIDDYLAAHIPGAVFFDVDAVSDHNNPNPHMYPEAAQFAPTTRKFLGFIAANRREFTILNIVGAVALEQVAKLRETFGAQGPGM